MKTNNIPVIVSKTETITKPFRGKAIYSPSGKAGEYSYWACNFYKGCSNGCTYCFLKKGRYKATLGGDKPTLKKSLKNEEHALKIFEKEFFKNLQPLREHGLFFSFTTDPMLPETIELTIRAMDICLRNQVPVKILTKCAEWEGLENGYPLAKYYKQRNLLINFPYLIKKEYEKMIAFSFTLTGHDKREPGASLNAERIGAMKRLHEVGFKTGASIEPVIDFQSSKRVILESLEFCDQYKIGLESGKKYKHIELRFFVKWVLDMTTPCGIKVYFKDSLLKKAIIKRSELPDNCVGRDYNLFK